MNRIKITLILVISFFLISCSELYYCSNPSGVLLTDQLPCANCDFRGTISPNFCPNATFPHKLQCLARKKGGNTVLLQSRTNSVQTRFDVYSCPVHFTQSAIRHDQTDVSNSCNYCRAN